MVQMRAFQHRIECLRDIDEFKKGQIYFGVVVEHGIQEGEVFYIYQILGEANLFFYKLIRQCILENNIPRDLVKNHNFKVIL